MNLFMQVLITETGLSTSFRPVLAELWKNIMRYQVWKSVEVHAIYEFIYLMCFNKKGIFRLRDYLGAEDPPIYEPFFIAQFLLVPVNTIAKYYLLPWIMKNYATLDPTSKKFCAKKLKAEVFLKYTLLTDLTKIVGIFKRKPINL